MISRCLTLIAFALVTSLAASGCAPVDPAGAPDGDAMPPHDTGADDADLIARSRCPIPGQRAVAELCNAFDDDCDGRMDEGVCSDPCGVFDAR